jgi:hypothetical protein
MGDPSEENGLLPTCNLSVDHDIPRILDMIQNLLSIVAYSSSTIDQQFKRQLICGLFLIHNKLQIQLLGLRGAQ